MPEVNLISLKDLAGLSAPLERLIEVVQRGVGKFLKSRHTRRDADADAHRISTISMAIASAGQEHGINASYSRDGVTIERPDQTEPTVSDNLSLEERAQARVSHVEQVRQINLEQIVSHAIMHLQEHDSVPTSRPTDDWIMRYFLNAPDACSNQMQDLWGRLLAGEILNPGSFSLQLISLINNLTPGDANIIEKLHPFTVCGEQSVFVPYPVAEYLQKVRNIEFDDFITLGELGIVFPSPPSIYLIDDGSETKRTWSFIDIDLIFGKIPANRKIEIPVFKFSRLGKELIKLCTSRGDLEFVDFVEKEIAKMGVEVSKKKRKK